MISKLKITMIYKKILYSILIFSLLISIFACEKDNKVGCLGCGIDTTPKVIGFRVQGKLLQDCSGTVAANKRIQGIYMKIRDTISLETVKTGLDGSFDFTYQDTFPYPYHPTPQYTAPFGIRVIDDAKLFVLTSTFNYSDLKLVLNDSIHCNIKAQLSAHSLALTQNDTLIYYMSNYFNFYENYGINSVGFKKAGPFLYGKLDELVAQPNIVFIDENGKSTIHFSCKIKHADGSILIIKGPFISTKESCLERIDEVLLLF
jgi:hypothetical protein